MKKTALLIIGGLLFVAGYYHVHRHPAYTEPKDAQAGFQTETIATPTTVFPPKIRTAFASHSDRPFLNNKF
ncbi:hypothetical protein [Spirosoma flavum]|uniref:Uncharacterized protein n=1 Tax=Spirosoma flavum TaxID=2048557 RepID=A0ABW6A9W0_9BACT